MLTGVTGEYCDIHYLSKTGKPRAPNPKPPNPIAPQRGKRANIPEPGTNASVSDLAVVISRADERMRYLIEAQQFEIA